MDISKVPSSINSTNGVTVNNISIIKNILYNYTKNKLIILFYGFILKLSVSREFKKKSIPCNR